MTVKFQYILLILAFAIANSLSTCSAAISFFQYRRVEDGRLLPIGVDDQLMSGNMTGYFLTVKTTRLILYFETNQRKEFMGFNVTWQAVYVNENQTTTQTTQTTTTQKSDGNSQMVIEGKLAHVYNDDDI